MKTKRSVPARQLLLCPGGKHVNPSLSDDQKPGSNQREEDIEECTSSSAAPVSPGGKHGNLSLSDDQKQGSKQRDEDIEECTGSSAAPVLRGGNMVI
jgi:hypothetical protein